MADFGSSLKNIWLKGMEAIGNTASSIASNTKSKVGEMNLVNRRAEILKDFGNQAYALFLKGEHFPEELECQLRELVRLDEELNNLRAERLAGVKAGEEVLDAEEEPREVIEDAAEKSEEASVTAAPILEVDADENVQEAVESSPAVNGSFPDDLSKEAEAEVPVIQVIHPEAEQSASTLSSAIDDLFESPTVKETTVKVNSALDSLEDGLKKFGEQMDRRIDEFTDTLSK